MVIWASQVDMPMQLRHLTLQLKRSQGLTRAVSNLAMFVRAAVTWMWAQGTQ